MAEVQIVGAGAIPTISTAVQTLVSVKAGWADSWVSIPYLQPVTAKVGIEPSGSSAQFRWVYGTIKREDASAFALVDPINLAGQFIKIDALDADGSHTIWIGIVVAEGFAMFGATTDPEGDQTIRAIGLEHLLDRKAIQGARIEIDSTVHEIGWSPIFNERQHWGTALDGNRSENEIDGSHVFSRNGSVWSHKNIAEYLLKYYAPSGIEWELGGQADILDNLFTVKRLEGMTFRQALRTLIDRRRGLGFVLRTTGEGKVTIHVFSVFDKPISGATKTVEPNEELYSIQVDDAIDAQNVAIDVNSAQVFDKIVVQGELIKTCFSVSLAEGTLEKAWTAADEAAYGAAGKTQAESDAEADAEPDDKKADRIRRRVAAKNDAERSSDRFERVYQAFRIPRSWDWKAGDGSSGSPSNVIPGLSRDGIYDSEKTPKGWDFPRPLLRNLPIQEHVDAADTDAEPEFLAPLVLVKDPSTDRFIQVEQLSTLEKQAGSVRMMDREMGFKLEFIVPHITGLNHLKTAKSFPDEPTEDLDNPTNLEPEVDYETIIATVNAETDHRLKVEIDTEIGTSGEFDRTLVVDVPGAEFWWIHERTVTGVTDGALARDAGNRTARDDTDRLRWIGALCKAWYGRRRSSVNLTVQAITEIAPVGSIITQISSAWHQEPVGTVVSSIAWNFGESQSTTITTDYQELDLVTIAENSELIDQRAVQRTLIQHERELKNLRDRVGNLPVREKSTPISFGAIVAGQVFSGTGDTYEVDLFANGKGEESTGRVTVTQLQIDDADTIPDGTWVFVVRLAGTYFMQVPVWLE